MENIILCSHLLENMGTEFLVYNNPNLGIIMQYPVGWTVLPEKVFKGLGTRFTSVALVRSNPYSTCAVSIKDPALETLDEFLEQRLDSKPSSIQRLIESKSTTVNNNPARGLVYLDDKGFYAIDFLTIKKGRGFIITFVTTKDYASEYMPIVEKMINSFETTK
jgi:hypothetical protein